MSLYPPPADRPLSVWSTLPEPFRRRGARPAWAVANRPGADCDSFLEGPSFDRDGYLWLTDIPFGRVFRVSPSGGWELIIEYDGWPNGLKIHRDGRLFISDYRRGLLRLDAARGAVETVLGHRRSEGFKGLNDLFFAADGRLYFTDQGQTGMHDPSGRVYRFDLDSGRLDALLDTAPSPNGLVTDRDERALFVAMTRGNAVWRVPLFDDGASAKVGVFVALAGGVSGADGLALDDDGGLYVCDAGNGCVWTFSRWGEPRYRLRSPTGGRATTNLAFGGADRRTLYVVESDTGTILRTTLDTPGRPMFALSGADPMT